jgi:hypothetical protein
LNEILSTTHEETPHSRHLNSSTHAARIRNNPRQLHQSKLRPILYRIMPSAEVTFISGNWVDNLTPEQQQNCYNEIVHFLQEEIIQQVLEKYDKPIASKY